MNRAERTERVADMLAAALSNCAGRHQPECREARGCQCGSALALAAYQAMRKPRTPLEAAPDLDELRTLAEEATPGPWTTDGPWWWDDETATHGPSESAMVTAVADRSPVVVVPPVGSEADARFIAAANPAAVLALIDKATRSSVVGTTATESAMASIASRLVAGRVLDPDKDDVFNSTHAIVSIVQEELS